MQEQERHRESEKAGGKASSSSENSIFYDDNSICLDPLGILIKWLKSLRYPHVDYKGRSLLHMRKSPLYHFATVR